MNLVKNIKLIATNVLLSEAESLRKLVDYLDQDFEATVKAILESNGRVVITGIGKSAIIANKIVATLNSTGTPAIFMHAADAIHGDLGMIQKEDVVICISNSGNTPEIKVLIPLLKRTGNKLIALVGKVDSYLARECDFVLKAIVEREADPNNLAPTNSTTAALALGDALAICLIEARSFTSTDFAKYHPGGTLGKKLYLKVSDLYSHHDLPLVKEDATVKQIIYEISSKRLGATGVEDDGGNLTGIITDGDLRRMLNNYDSLTGIVAKDIMTKSPKTIDHEEYAVNALTMMQNMNITQVVVVKEGNFVGFVHIHDLLKEGLI